MFEKLDGGDGASSSDTERQPATGQNVKAVTAGLRNILFDKSNGGGGSSSNFNKNYRRGRLPWKED